MNSPRDEISALLGEAQRIRNELARLEAIEDVLEEALGDFEHQLRRVGDGLVRAGGRSMDLEGQAKLFHDNRKLTLEDLEKNRARRRTLDERLSAIDGELSKLKQARNG